MSLDFTDCSNALLTYSLTDNGAEGDIDITRVIPGGKALCEELGGGRLTPAQVPLRVEGLNRYRGRGAKV